MLNKIGAIFARDLKVNVREVLTLYMLAVPIIFGVVVQVLVPSVNEATANLAVLDSESPARIAYLEQFAYVETFPNVAEVERRLQERDHIVAILPQEQPDAGHYLLTQGNEPESVVELAKLLNTFAVLDLQPDATNVTLNDFGRTDSPLKRGIVNVFIMFIGVLGGMMIALNIVEEKMDNTVSAINVTPLSRTGFILGKSLMGLLLAIYGVMALLLITGYSDVNFGQVLLLIVGIAALSIIVGFLQGLYAEDQMDAAGSVKLLFLPIIAGVAAAELLGESAQVVAYWIPFYWAYLGNDAILSYEATWGQILLYSGLVVAICAMVFFALAPRIQRRLTAV